MGNSTPVADLMVASPKSKIMFLVDVKGLHKKNSWVLKRKTQQSTLYYVFAFVPDDAPNQFFVMTQHQANVHLEEELTRLARSEGYPMTGILWKQTVSHENAWDTLPS